MHCTQCMTSQVLLGLLLQAGADEAHVAMATRVLEAQVCQRWKSADCLIGIINQLSEDTQLKHIVIYNDTLFI